MKKKWIALVLAGAMVMTAFTGCGNKKSDDSATKDDSAATEESSGESTEIVNKEATIEVPEEVTKGGELKIALTSSPKNLDPVKYTGTYEAQIIYQVCDTVVTYDKELKEILPSLATDWIISDDGMEYTFTIRDDVYFQPGEYQDGRLMTAEDVAYNMNRSAKESAMNRLDMLDHAEAIDETHVKATLKAPSAVFLTALTNAGNAIVPKEEVEGWGEEFGNHLVGTGPYAMEKFELDQQTTLKKNEKYFIGEPNLDTVIFKVITDANQEVNALRTGDVDIATQLTGETVKIVAEDETVNLEKMAGIQIGYAYFNMVNGPTADAKVREALIKAVDYKELAAGVYQYGEGEAACLPLPRASWGYDESVEADVPSYDPDGAKKLLEEAGYGDGITLNMYITNETFRQKAATILQSYWQAIGVELKINTVEWGTFSETAASGKADVFAMAWSWYPDPYFFFDKMFATSAIGTLGNGQGYSNPEVDQLLSDALIETDQAKRAEMYKKALKIITDDNPGIFYGNPAECLGINPKVQDFNQRADGTIKLCTAEENVWVVQ
ncbi:ABC transporter substrate-binding protein [Lactonifactor longoviformis]|uniref:Peptide/nickel transport system substrate-binding protein n=1 Tax=Lactonifactor longoviformis DSM 17459 TaxID=1122155 RepID=A0A1M5CPE0_9CLOT|nr:ABC transporter substrate-binding protein [Lactonifactor longoviformis]POP32208.1 ABC transporter substrate-binding protein [Lactonifactor longoviformis]SHF56467.1 peptide/nickel transport system substrate-binding protein [Lactonifactor longoviformis DSM 17459]